MKISVVVQLIKSIKKVLAYDFDHLFKKTRLVSGSEETKDAVYAREHDVDLDLIQEQFGIEDDDKLQMFLHNLKSATSDLVISQSDVLSVKAILELDSEKRALDFLEYLKYVVDGLAPKEEDITYCLGSVFDDFIIEPDEEDEEETQEEEEEENNEEENQSN